MPNKQDISTILQMIIKTPIMLRNKRYFFSLANFSLFILIMFAGCSKDDDKDTNITNYSNSVNWLNIPAPLKKVDVFYLYPSAWTRTATDGNICTIDNASMQAGAPLAFSRQALLFDTVANVFAPFYRQADAQYVLSLPAEKRWDFISGMPSKDAIAAFEYYIDHFNHGRPFILAGHSQGANILLFLLSEYMKDHPDVYSRMIAAYVIGYPVTTEFLNSNPHLRFATGPDDTGVIISYNTQAPDVVPGTNPVVSDIKGLVINPISWTRDETVAPASASKGSLMPDAQLRLNKVPHYADAAVDAVNGVLICSSANEEALLPLTSAFGRGVYHTFDYLLYYYDLQANAITRVNKYIENNPASR
jgi:hypothetical protein